MNNDAILDDDYEHVIVNGQEELNDTEHLSNNEVVYEIFPFDVSSQADDNACSWSHDAVRYLIYCWSKLIGNFKKYTDKNKKVLWQIVSDRMVEQGFYFDALTCEIKWTELKKLYVHNKKQINKNEGDNSVVVWSHYFDMYRAIKGIPLDVVVDDNGDDNNCLQDKSCNTTTVLHDNTTFSVTNIDKCHWSDGATRDLIRLYDQNQNKFLAVNQGDKQLLWEEISRQLLHLGYQYSANVCYDKWRNLKMTHKINKQKEMKYGIQRVKWIFFKDMENILSPFKCEDVKFEEFNDVITVSSLTENNVLENMKNEEDNNENFQVVDGSTAINNGDEDNLEMLETWTEAATKCLIELWGIYRPRFLVAPQGRKRMLWNEISEKLRQKGHNYSSLVCDRKWRLLKANYLKRKEKYKKLGAHNVKWQYYRDLDRLLGVPVEVSWTLESTMWLIDSFDRHKEKFMMAATGEKHLIWNQISGELAEHGFSFSPRACDNKWRTLKNRYNKNRIRFNNNKQVNWVYYKKIDKILRELNKEKNSSNGGASCSRTNSQTKEDVELDEHNYIKTSKEDSFLNNIAELKEMINFRNVQLDEKFNKMKDELDRREKVFHDLQQQTLSTLNKFYEIEVHKIKMLEKLVSKK